MAKLKDGFYKQTAEAVGSNSYMLLAGGGSKALSDFATASEVVTALGTNGNYVTWTKNGTANNLTVPYATTAGSVAWGNITGKPSSYTPSAHDHTRILFIDDRDVVETPTDVAGKNGIEIHFKNKSKSSVPSTGTWTAVVMLDGYSDTSGGYPMELGFSMSDLSASRPLYLRTPKTSTEWGGWRMVLDSTTYTDYINTTNFPGLNSVGDITEVKAGTGLSGGGTSGSVTLTNAGVRSTTINGNYLRVNTNGTNTDLTIPYATNASTATNAKKILNYYTSRPTSIAPGVSGDGSMFHFKCTSSVTDTTTDPGDAHILHFNWDNAGGYDFQIAGLTSTSTMKIRGMQSGTWLSWATVLTNANSTVSGGGSTWGSSITVNIGGTSKTLTIPSNPNTHWTTRIYAGASGIAANAAAANPYLKVTDDNTYRNQVRFIGGGATTVSSDANGNITISSTDNNTDTKNTAGSTNTSSKIFLIGATSQAVNPQTYSHDTAYVGTDGCLYSNSTKVSVEGHIHEAYTKNLGKSNYVTFTVDGDANIYYPVIISKVGSKYPLQFVNISRGYAETAPDSWNTATHKGGLTLTLLWNGSQYWDGNSSGSACYCVFVNETYCTMVGGLDNSTSGKVVWLRGGGAVYHIHSIAGTDVTADVKLTSYTDSASRTFSPIITPQSYTVAWPGNVTGNSATASNADKLDGVHANGLLTALSSNTTNAVSITVGGTTKNITAATLKASLGLGNVQNTAFYKRVVTVNGSGWDMAGTNSNAAFTIYAPTTAGTSGQILTSTGGTPGWTDQSSIVAGYTYHLGATSISNLNTPNWKGSGISADIFTKTASNKPHEGNNANGVINFSFTKHGTSSYFGFQLAQGNGSDRLYFRQATGGSSTTSTFTGWKTIAYTSDIPTVGNGTVTITQGGTTKGSFTMNQSGNTTIALTDNNTNQYHTRVYSSGLKISTGTGVSDMYVPTGTTSTLGVVKQHTAADCTSYTSDEGATTPAAVKKAITTFVSIARNLTSGTKIGTITIGDTATDLYCQTNTNTDTKVTQTVTSSNATYPLLLAPSGQTATTTTTSYFDSGVTLNPSTNTITANITGSAGSVAWANVTGKPTIPTVTNYYWANVNISSSSNSATTPTFSTITTTGISYVATLRPSTTETYHLGSVNNRWNGVFSTTGNFSGRITSSVAVGTAPFNITSTTVNANLNADMVDGKHASDFAPASHLHSYLPLSGGTISNTSYGPLTIERKDSANMAAIKFKNNNGDLGSIGMNAVNGNLIIYNAATSASRTILDSGNSSVSGGGSSWGSSITVKINGTTKTLTIPSNPNTWRGITDSYSGTDSTISLSQKGGNALYNALVNGYAASAGNAETVDTYHIWAGTRAEYNSTSGNANTIYFVTD